MNTAILHTLEFLREAIQAKNPRVLQVGTGNEELTTALTQNGYQVQTTPNFLEFSTDDRFDAILFSWSLHLAGPLETVFNKVKTLLDEKGKLLIEDSYPQNMDAKTADWFYELHDLVAALSGKVIEPEVSGEGPLERWKKFHSENQALHAGNHLIRTMERNFGNIHSTFVPHLFRSFVNEIAMQRVFDWEKKSIEKGYLQPVGLRIVAKKYFSYLR